MQRQAAESGIVCCELTTVGVPLASSQLVLQRSCLARWFFTSALFFRVDLQVNVSTCVSSERQVSILFSSLDKLIEVHVTSLRSPAVCAGRCIPWRGIALWDARERKSRAAFGLGRFNLQLPPTFCLWLQ